MSSSKNKGVALTTVSMLLIATYVAAQILSDIGSLKIGVVAGLAVDMGTFIYPITFTLRDSVHKAIGKKLTRQLVIASGVINLLMTLFFLFAAKVPGDPSWGLQEEFSAIFAPIWRIVFASIVAEVISELVDTEVYQWFVDKVTTKYQWARVLVSNSVSVPIDNFLFAFIAFAGTMPMNVVWQIFFFNLIVKFAVTVLSIPLIYITPDTHAEVIEEENVGEVE